MSTKMLLEQLQIVEGVPAVLLNDGNNTGDWVSLKNYNRCVVLFVSGLGTDTQDPTLTLQQAKDVSGGSVKDLDFTTIYRKQAATSLAAVGQWTKTTQAASNTFVNTDSAEQALIYAIEFKADDLDVDNAFDCLRITVADVGGNAQPGWMAYILGDPREANAPEDMLSAIVN